MPHTARPRAAARTCLLLTAALAALSARAVAQDGSRDDEAQPPKNLQLLPADISRQELERVMREFALALGVRCSHCHVQSREVRDFAADNKPTKRTARGMMRLVAQINQSLQDEAGSSVLTVECVTCHRGNPSPRTLRRVLGDVVEREGLDAALARYGQLRDEFYGSGVYDFSESSLLALARDLSPHADGGQAEIGILRLNLTLFPESAMTRVQLADALHRAGDDQEARTHLEEALQLDPGNRRARRQLEQLTGEGAPPPP